MDTHAVAGRKSLSDGKEGHEMGKRIEAKRKGGKEGGGKGSRVLSLRI